MKPPTLSRSPAATSRLREGKRRLRGGSAGGMPLHQKGRKGHTEKRDQILPRGRFLLCPRGKPGWQALSCLQATLLPGLHLGASSPRHCGSALPSLHWCFIEPLRSWGSSLACRTPFQLPPQQRGSLPWQGHVLPALGAIQATGWISQVWSKAGALSKPQVMTCLGGGGEGPDKTT